MYPAHEYRILIEAQTSRDELHGNGYGTIVVVCRDFARDDRVNPARSAARLLRGDAVE